MKHKKALMFAAAVMLCGAQVKQADATAACCRVFSNGVARAFGSFNCNLSSSETRRLGIGTYEVDFLYSDIRGAAKSATCDSQGTSVLAGCEINIADRLGDFSSVYIQIRDFNGALVDRSFDVCLH